MQNEMKLEMSADMLEPERERVQIFVDLREKERVCRYSWT